MRASAQIRIGWQIRLPWLAYDESIVLDTQDKVNLAILASDLPHPQSQKVMIELARLCGAKVPDYLTRPPAPTESEELRLP